MVPFEDRTALHGIPPPFPWHQSPVSIITTSPRVLDRDLPCRFLRQVPTHIPECRGLAVGGPCDGVIIRAPGVIRGGMCVSPAMCAEHGRWTDIIGLDETVGPK
jgi:hypothetical protein